jgi:hypothetical protein
VVCRQTLPEEVQRAVAARWAAPVAEGTHFYPNVSALFRGHWRHVWNGTVGEGAIVPAGTRGRVSLSWTSNATDVDRVHLLMVRPRPARGSGHLWRDLFVCVCSRLWVALTAWRGQGNLHVRDDEGGRRGHSLLFNVQGLYFGDRGLVLAVGTTLEYVAGHRPSHGRRPFSRLCVPTRLCVLVPMRAWVTGRLRLPMQA